MLPDASPDALPDPAPPAPPHVIGEGYEFDAIRAQLGGKSTPPNFLIHRDGVILGLCLGLMWHPKAEANPREVWVGRNGDLPGWGARLSEVEGPIPVYVRRRAGGPWIFIGPHTVTGSTTDPAAIRMRLNPPAITNISRVVFLKPARQGHTDRAIGI